MTNREDVGARITPEIDARRRPETPRSRTSALLAVVHGRGGAHAPLRLQIRFRARHLETSMQSFSSRATRQSCVPSRAMALTKMRARSTTSIVDVLGTVKRWSRQRNRFGAPDRTRTCNLRLRRTPKGGNRGQRAAAAPQSY